MPLSRNNEAGGGENESSQKFWVVLLLSYQMPLAWQAAIKAAHFSGRGGSFFFHAPFSFLPSLIIAETQSSKNEESRF